MDTRVAEDAKTKRKNSRYRSASGWKEETIVVASGLALATVALLHHNCHPFYWEHEPPWWEQEEVRTPHAHFPPACFY